MDTAKSDGVPHTREYGMAFSRIVRTEKSSFQSNLRIDDNRKEPGDVLYQFAMLNSSMEHFDLIIILVLPHICEVPPCQRLVPLLFTEVLRNKDRTALGSLDILRDDEPIDVINRFVQASVIAAVYGDKASLYSYNVLQEVCEEVLCTRSTTVVYKKTINDSNATALGTVEVFEFKEVVDAVIHFLAETNAEIYHITLKNYLFQNICGLPLLNCTRNVAYVFDQMMAREDGEDIGRLAILDNQEPSNIVYEWSKTYGLDKGYILDVNDTLF